MLDPIPPPPRWLQSLVEPLSDYFSLPVLPFHIHEVLLAFTLYHFIYSIVAPRLSSALFPSIYPNFPTKTRLSWNVHVVSLVQSTLINVLALWVMRVDKERSGMTSGERVYGYTGAGGLVQAMAAGYFLWDLMISTVHFKIFGPGMWFHAISALWVFSFGFRPFLNFYGPTFILYELSSPFLNFHWFMDKVNMTGSRAQWYNGMVLLTVFFSCRLVWGTWQSVQVYIDVWKALWQTPIAAVSSLEDPVKLSSVVFGGRDGSLCIDEVCAKANAEIARFAQHTDGGVPKWLAFTYLASNLILNSLNFYWFSKMIATVMARFKEASPSGDGGKPGKTALEVLEDDVNDVVLDAAAKLEEEDRLFIDGGLVDSDEKTKSTSAQVDGKKASTRRRRG